VKTGWVKENEAPKGEALPRKGGSGPGEEQRELKKDKEYLDGGTGGEMNELSERSQAERGGQ